MSIANYSKKTYLCALVKYRYKALSNMQNFKLLFTVILLIYTTTLNVAAYHTDPPLQDTLEVETISIVAQKNGSNLRNAPIAASVLNGNELEVAKVSSIKDFTLAIPNLYMPDYGTKLTSPIYIRGIGSRINSPSVGLYVDGIPYLEKSSFDFDLFEVSSIEVLRGPQGTLFGRNTMGGVVCVTTKAPLSSHGTTIGVDYGSYNTLRTSISDYRNFSEHWGYGIALNYEHNDGFFTNNYIGDKADRLDSGGGDLKLRYKKDNVDLNIVAGVESSFQNGYPYMMLDPDSGEPQEVSYNSPSHYRRFMSSNGVLLKVAQEVFTFTSRTSYQFIQDEQGIDQDFSEAQTYYITQSERHNIFSQDLQFSSATQGMIDWTGGLFGFYQKSDNSVIMNYFASDMTTDKFYNTPRYGVAAYAQGTIHLGKFDITAGARYDIELAEMSYDYLKNGSEPVDNFTSSLCHDQFTPKIALQYNFTENRMVYGTITKGFKAGGFNTSFETEQERTFEPEYSWNYEVGTKLSLLGGHLYTSLALFYIDWSQQQVYQPLSTGIGSLLRNAASSYSTGVEVSLSAHLLDNLRLRADYGYTQAKFIDYVVEGTADYSGNYIPYAPQNTFSVALDYTLKLPKYKLLFAAQYNGAGKIYFNDANSTSQDLYSTLNARVSLERDWASISLWAKNITASEYYAFSFSALGNSYVQLGDPFTVGVAFSFKL